MGILDGIVEWIAEQVMAGLDLVTTSVLGALGCDMAVFLRYFPAAETMYSVFVALAIGIILLNWVWQLFKNFGLGAGVEAEDPVKLSIRSVIFILLTLFSDEIVNIVLTIGGTPYHWIMESDLPALSFAVITGSPGTGKTTVLRTILEVYRRLHPDGKIALMAPTGRASRRMSESTGFEDARTLHSGLGLTSEEDEGSRNRKSEPLSADLIIVDEFSMVDMWLAEKFFERMKANARIVLVGDPDQLPSVGAGNVFREIIETQIVPVTVLDQIFRQSKDSLIAYNAKFINEGNTKLFYGPDFVFVSGDSQEDTAEKITERYCLEIQESGIENVQILSPFRSEGAASSEQLNETIRELVNPFRSAEEEIKFGPRIFRVNDRIMQTKNTEKVSNGDLGFIRYIKDTDQGKKIGMDFGAGRTLEYGVDDLSNVDLAYATTIHKAMGSEYETVIMPLLKAHTIMMYRNLLYTGITRAKKRVVLIGQKQVLFMAIHRNEIGKRNTLLGMRIQMYFKAYAKKAGIPIPAALEEQLKNAS